LTGNDFFLDRGEECLFRFKGTNVDLNNRDYLSKPFLRVISVDNLT